MSQAASLTQAPALLAPPSVIAPSEDDHAQRPAPAALAQRGNLGTIDELLRSPRAMLDRIQRAHGLADLVRTMLVTIAVASAIFGAALGFYRGGMQVLYAGIKFPLVLLLTAALCAPCLSAFNAALDRPFSLRRDVALVLAALALGSLLLVAQAPLLLLFALVRASYHTTILLASGCAALAGLGSLVMLGRGVRAQSPHHARSAALALVLVFAVVGAQMAWTLRPYLVRPRSPEVEFVRSIEGSLFEAVLTSVDSARGFYHRDYAPLPDDQTRSWDLDDTGDLQ